MLTAKVGNHEIEFIPYILHLSPENYAEWQIRLIIGNLASNLSKGEIKCLTYMYLYPNINEAINQIIELNIRNSKKSVLNDVSKFKELELIDITDNRIDFKLPVCKSFEYFLIEIKEK